MSSCHAARSRRLGSVLGLAVSLTLAAMPALALDQTDTGAAGSAGSPGSDPSGSGGPGTPGGTVIFNPATSDNSNSIGAVGGTGGSGGDGGPGSTTPALPGGNGGNGAAGGSATAGVSTTGTSLTVNNSVVARGGTGGTGGGGGSGIPDGLGGAGANGGDATASVTGQNTSDQPVNVNATAIGGDGGWGGSGRPYSGAYGAAGGVAHLGNVNGSSSGGGAVTVNGSVTGGNGGFGLSVGSPGGNGAAESLNNALTGSTTGNLTLVQYVNGGNSGGATGANAGVAGSATSYMSYNNTTSSAVSLSSNANGGYGGFTTGANGVAGAVGNATADIHFIGYVTASATGAGGNGSGFQNGTGNTGGAGAAGFSTANATSTGTAVGLSAVAVTSSAQGGNGGSIYTDGEGNSSGTGYGGNGGTAQANATASSAGPDGISLMAGAQGGNGGTGGGAGFRGGNGAKGFIGSGGAGSGGSDNTPGVIQATSTGGAPIDVAIQVHGGNGGVGASGASGGNGADETLIDTYDGSTRATTGNLAVEQTAYGGNSGSSNGGNVGLAGNAFSSLTLTQNMLTLVGARVDAWGGDAGGTSYNATGATAGTATATVNLTSDSPLQATAYANSTTYGAGIGAGSNIAGAGTPGPGATGTANATGTGTGTTAGNSQVRADANAVGTYGGWKVDDGTGTTGNGANGGNGVANATATGAGPDDIRAQAYATGGAGGQGLGSGFHGGRAGNATATAIGTGSGSGFVAATANASSTLAGAGSSGATNGSSGSATPSAYATTTGGGTTQATATGAGSSGSSYAKAQAASTGLVLLANGTATSVVDGNAVSDARAFNGRYASQLGPSSIFSQQAAAYALGQPDGGDVGNAWSTATHVPAALNNDATNVQGLGTLGGVYTNDANASGAAHLSTSVVEFKENGALLTGNRLLAGLLSSPLIGSGLGAGDSLSFTILRQGTAVASPAVFTTNAAVAAYFNDNVIDLGVTNAGLDGKDLDVQFRFEITTHSAGNGVAAEFLLGSTSISNADTWANASGGTWASPSNWTDNTMPDGPGALATFSSAISTARTVTLDENTTVGTIQFDNANSYTIASGFNGSLTLDDAGSPAAISVTAGSHTISAPVTLAAGLAVATAASTNLTLSGTLTTPASSIIQKSGSGTLTLSGPIIAGTAAALSFTGGTTNINVNPGSNVSLYTFNSGTQANFAAATSGGIQLRNLDGLIINSTSKVTLQTSSAHANRTLLVANSLTNFGPGTLDIGGNDMILHNADVASLIALAHSGYTGGGGNWAGAGLTSSTAAADSHHAIAIGIILNSNAGNRLYGSGAPRGLFDGQDALITDVLVKETFFGDSDLSGSVNAADYSRVDNGFAFHLSGWINGDFNYDGSINAADYSLIDNAFNFQGTVGGPLAATAPLATTLAEAAVPEPTALLLLAVSAGGLTIRRRRSR